MIYPGLLPIPATRIKLCDPDTIGGPCVVNYASNPANFPALSTRFAAFAKTLPDAPPPIPRWAGLPRLAQHEVPQL